MSKQRIISKQKRKEKKLSSLPKTQFNVGDLIQVRDGVMDYNWSDLPLGGWVGRVDKVTREADNVTYDVTWTDETLEKIHPIYKSLTDLEFLIFDKYTFLKESDIQAYSADGEVILAEPDEDVIARYKNRPLLTDDQWDRWRIVFGVGPLEHPMMTSDDGATAKYFDYLSKHLSFPFDAGYRKSKKHPAIDISCEKIFLSRDQVHESIYEIFCEAVDTEGHKYRLSLTEISLPGDSPFQELIGDYQDWRY